MKRIARIILLLFATSAYGQSSALRELVDAEKAFIEMARTVNRRDAFLFFLGDSAVTQGPDGPVRGKARIASQPVSEDWLDWAIRYSEVSASGDFGFNTGPWNYRPKKTDERPSSFGEFNSVWKKQPDGTWKNVLDIGISHGPAESTPVWTTAHPGTQPCTRERSTKVMSAENEFLAQLTKKRNETYRSFVSPEAHLMISGHHPFKGTGQLSAFLTSSPEVSGHSLMGSETSSSGDLGYVYGTAIVRLTPGGNTETRKATYVRIWKLEECQWRIILDVLTF